jgi:hypothetical protein
MMDGAQEERPHWPTGDNAVDEALGALEEVTEEPLDTQIEVGERVQRVLQGRLVDLGKE